MLVPKKVAKQSSGKKSKKKKNSLVGEKVNGKKEEEEEEKRETIGKPVKVNKKDVLCLSTTRQQLGTRRCILNTIQHFLTRLISLTSDKIAR